MYLNAVLPISTFFFMNVTVKTVHICRFTDRYFLWNDRFSVLSQKFCPFKGFLDLNSRTLEKKKKGAYSRALVDEKSKSLSFWIEWGV